MKTIMRFKKLRPEARAPERAHPTDAGFDVFSAVDCTIKPGEVVKVATGIAIHVEPEQIDPGYNVPGGWTYACLAWDKSGLGSRGIKVFGGVIDDPYTGEVFVVLGNMATGGWFDLLLKFFRTAASWGYVKDHTPPGDFAIEAGQKLCNLLVQRVELPEAVEVEALKPTDRGAGGFASTGL